ncbi:MAG: hypothetical protein DSM106950_41765 [Stigonema ocellatum SAG 48.90 = DSM 106950]|nr:hypothetical protein [Stigonema ocellatum SAG 48.90 = DSM 106950]
MKISSLLLVSILAFTPATALAQQEQRIYRLSIINEQKAESEVLLHLRIHQQVRKFNTDVEQAISQTRAIKQFSRPYIDEFQRRNEQIQNQPDKVIRIRSR